jgi:hypothetical protein
MPSAEMRIVESAITSDGALWPIAICAKAIRLSALKVIRIWNLTMRLSDAGLHQRQTKALYPDHRLSPWLTEAATRDRSNRLLGVIVILDALLHPNAPSTQAQDSGVFQTPSAPRSQPVSRLVLQCARSSRRPAPPRLELWQRAL